MRLPSRPGHLSPLSGAGPRRVRTNASVCVRVGVCVAVLVGVCTVPVTALQCVTLREVCLSLFSSGFFLDNCASSVPSGCGILGSAGTFSVCMFLAVACSLLPRSDLCSPCLHGLFQFCVVC